MFALLAVCCLGAVAFPVRSGAATTSSSTPNTAGAPAAASTSPKMVLLDQPSWVTDGDSFPLRLRITNPQPGLEIHLTMHPHVATRTNFEETVAGQDLGGALDTASIAVADAQHATGGVVLAQFGVSGSDVPSAQTLRPRDTGVYPITVELRSGSGVLDQFVTWMVYVRGYTRGAKNTTAIAEPLRVSWVWSIVAPPAHGLDGQTPNPNVLAAMLPGGRLNKIANLMPAAKGVPLTLDVSPETLSSWVAFAKERPQLAKGAAAVRAAAGSSTNDLLPEPYVPIDLPSFENADLGPYLSDELLAGSETLRNIAGVRVDPRTAFVDPVDSTTLNRLHSLFLDQVLLRDTSLAPRQSNLTPARPFTINNGDEDFLAASTNPTVESWLAGNQPAALRAQRFVAGLSLIAMEAPSQARGIVVASPTDWSPNTTAVAHALRGLRTNPLLEPVTLTKYFSDIPHDVDTDGNQLVRSLVPHEPERYPVTAAAYAHARRALDSFSSLVGDSNPEIEQGRETLLVALTSLFTPTRAKAELATIDQKAADFLGQITTTQQRITLTARRAEIPLAFRNATGQPVRVRVTLAAPSGKALFPDGAQKLITLAPGNQTVRFTVEARATGTFAMIVTLTSEDGQLPIGAPTQITVRSTVFSGWGAALTIGALVFLALWWANHIWRSRRAARATVAPA